MSLTIEQLSEITLEDAQMYYNNSFLRFKEPEQSWKWGQVICFDGQKKGRVVTVTTDSVKGSTKTLPLSGAVEWEINIPPCHCYNFKGNSLEFFRLPHRQNRKGFGPETCTFTEILYPLYATGKIPSALYEANRFCFSVNDLNLLFNEMQSIPLAKSIESVLKHQSFARALNDEIQMTQGLFNKNPTLFHRSTLIGEYNADKDRVELSTGLFEPEVMETFSPVNVPVIVQQQ